MSFNKNVVLLITGQSGQRVIPTWSAIVHLILAI